MKLLIEVQDFKKITQRVGGIHRKYPVLIKKKNRKMSNLETLLGSQPMMPKSLPRTLDIEGG